MKCYECRQECPDDSDLCDACAEPTKCEMCRMPVPTYVADRTGGLCLSCAEESKAAERGE